MEEQKTEEQKYQLKCHNMKPLFILIAQSVTGAVITIICLLLVAAVIGYLTAWFYAKSVYTPVIKSLEENNTELKKQIAGLNEEISALNRKVDNLNVKVTQLEEEIAQREKEIVYLNNPEK
jgi:peptidoglycan hydrolase CwlO-like protein